MMAERFRAIKPQETEGYIISDQKVHLNLCEVQRTGRVFQGSASVAKTE
jgi:hypothetical protein